MPEPAVIMVGTNVSNCKVDKFHIHEIEKAAVSVPLEIEYAEHSNYQLHAAIISRNVIPTFYAHIIIVIMCEKYFCARCIAECAILPRHCEYQEKLFGKTPSRFYSKTNQSSLLSFCVRGQWRFEGGVFSSFAL